MIKFAGKAVGWSALGNLSGLIGGLISLVVLARILSPEQFGIYGIVIAVLLIPETLACNSIHESLIQRRDLTREHSNSIFLQSLALASTFTGLVYLAAPYIADLFGQNEVTAYLRVMACTLIIGAVAAVPSAHLQRNLRFKAIAAVDFLGTVISTAIGITAAILLQDAWALVALELSRRVIRMLAFIYFDRWLPSVRTSWSATRDLMRFSLNVSGVRTLIILETVFPRMLIGAILGPAALGMFNLAMRVQDQVNSALIIPFGSVSLPLVTRTLGNKDELFMLVKAAIQLAAFVTYPSVLGAVVIAPIAVPLVFGDQWIEAIAVIQISLLMVLRRPTEVFNGGLLKGIGRPDVLLKVAAINILLICLAIIPAIGLGLEAIMLALFIQRILAWLLISLSVSRLLGFSLREQLSAGHEALVASGIMAIIVWIATPHLAQALAPAIALSLAILIGAFAYLITIAIIARKYLIELIRKGYGHAKLHGTPQ